MIFAYIGPGAGIALAGSLLVVLLSLLSAFLAIVLWPIRRLWRMVRGQRAMRNALVERVVVLGLDGLEPSLVDEYLARGLLPNLARLRELGGYQRLGTSWPPLSPVAWSSFSTGTNPGKHCIFDFIARNPETYSPAISSVRIGKPTWVLPLGRYRLPLSKPDIKLLRKSKPFWSVLGEAGIFSAIIRVPITFPPDRFRGVQLSAMCVPDLTGTQGTFLYFSEEGDAGQMTEGDVGGERIIVRRHGTEIRSQLKGPDNPLDRNRSELQVPFSVVPGRNGSDALLKLGRQRVPLNRNIQTPWVRFSYRAAPGVKIHGMTRFLLKRFEGGFEMYATPVQIDPDRPVMPISHPTVYSSYLARKHGAFSTLGLAEDTWSLSEGVLSEDEFLHQAYGIHDERKSMFFDALSTVRRGLVVCVFDAPDRIQHMFWRFLDDDHPALRGQVNSHPQAIAQMYAKMDELVGETMNRIGKNDTLLVISDHGFKPFRRCVDLNCWLLKNGYLFLKKGDRSTTSYLGDVDWSRTRAYAIGLAGIYVNQSGRESRGIVDPQSEKQQLVDEITAKLSGLIDDDSGEVAIHEAIPCTKSYHGPYVDDAPDIIVGYNEGYRISWDSAVGKTSGQTFFDNVKAWSGDHCIHPDLVPGVLFSNRELNGDSAAIRDLAPTILELLGVPKPQYMDGASLVRTG